MEQALLSLLQVKVSAPRAQPLYNSPASVAGLSLVDVFPVRFCTCARRINGARTGVRPVTANAKLAIVPVHIF